MLNSPAGTHTRVMPSTGEVQVCPISVHTGGIEESVAGGSVAVGAGRGVAVLTSSGEGVCAGPQALNTSRIKRYRMVDNCLFMGNLKLGFCLRILSILNSCGLLLTEKVIQYQIP